MNVLDIIIVVIILFFLWRGFRAGLVGAIGSFVGIIAGIWVGTHYMQAAGAWVMSSMNIDNSALANILGFIGLFIAVNIVVAIVVMIINKLFHIVPFIDLINKLLGAFVGLLGGILTVSALIYLLSLMPFSDAVANTLISSQLAHYANQAAVVIKPFIPEAIKALRSIL